MNLRGGLRVTLAADGLSRCACDYFKLCCFQNSTIDPCDSLSIVAVRLPIKKYEREPLTIKTKLAAFCSWCMPQNVLENEALNRILHDCISRLGHASMRGYIDTC